MSKAEQTSALTNQNRRATEGTARPAVFLINDSLETGGSERQFATLGGALTARSFRVHLGCIQRKGAFLDEMDEVREFPLGGSFLTVVALRSHLALRRYLRAERIAVAHAFDFYTNLMLVPTARLARVPVVIGSHRQIGDLLTPWQFRAQALALRLCDRVVCNSWAAARALNEHGLSEAKLVVIRNAIPDQAFAEVVPALPRRTESLRVGMIARMNNPVKNHPAFLRAAARLAARFPTAEFVLAGDGPLRSSLERMARDLGIEGRVIFLGDRRDIPAVLASLDVSVLPSFSESLPNAVLESMAAGLPVVASRVGGNPEVVVEGETGLLTPPHDEDALVAALDLLLAQPSLRMQLGRQAKERARANFGLAQICTQLEQLYQSLLEEKGWHRARSQGSMMRQSATSELPLRVTLVAASPRWIGGQGVQASLLVRHWQDDPAIRVRFVPVDPELPRSLAWVERIPYLRTVLRHPFYLAALWRGIKEADVVHIFSASYWSFLLAPVPAWLVAQLRGKKTLINYHSGEARDHLRHWRSALPVLKRADRLVVPSRYLVDIFRGFGLAAHVVPNTVDLSQFAYRPRRPLRPLLVCTRGFDPYYRVDLVVRAFAEVKRQFPEARLCLVGKGPLESEVRALVCQLELLDVEFTGPVPHEEIQAFYDRNDIFINASSLDNMPISVLEAFAAGTPVVSTEPEGLHYVVEHERTGLLCAPEDWQALAQNAISLLRDPDLASRLARNSYEECRRYSWETVRAQWLEVYQSLRGSDVPSSATAASAQTSAKPRVGETEQPFHSGHYM